VNQHPALHPDGTEGRMDGRKEGRMNEWMDNGKEPVFYWTGVSLANHGGYFSYFFLLLYLLTTCKWALS
jgi:hypothetical protein